MNAIDHEKFQRIEDDRMTELMARHLPGCEYVVETIDTYPAFFRAMAGTCTCGADKKDSE